MGPTLSLDQAVNNLWEMRYAAKNNLPVMQGLWGEGVYAVVWYRRVFWLFSQLMAKLENFLFFENSKLEELTEIVEKTKNAFQKHTQELQQAVKEYKNELITRSKRKVKQEFENQEDFDAFQEMRHEKEKIIVTWLNTAGNLLEENMEECLAKLANIQKDVFYDPKAGEVNDGRINTGAIFTNYDRGLYKELQEIGLIARLSVPNAQKMPFPFLALKHLFEHANLSDNRKEELRDWVQSINNARGQIEVDDFDHALTAFVRLVRGVNFEDDNSSAIARGVGRIEYILQEEYGCQVFKQISPEILAIRSSIPSARGEKNVCAIDPEGMGKVIKQATTEGLSVDCIVLDGELNVARERRKEAKKDRFVTFAIKDDPSKAIQIGINRAALKMREYEMENISYGGIRNINFEEVHPNGLFAVVERYDESAETPWKTVSGGDFDRDADLSKFDSLKTLLKNMVDNKKVPEHLSLRSLRLTKNGLVSLRPIKEAKEFNPATVLNYGEKFAANNLTIYSFFSGHVLASLKGSDYIRDCVQRALKGESESVEVIAQVDGIIDIDLIDLAQKAVDDVRRLKSNLQARLKEKFPNEKPEAIDKVLFDVIGNVYNKYKLINAFILQIEDEVFNAAAAMLKPEERKEEKKRS